MMNNQRHYGRISNAWQTEVIEYEDGSYDEYTYAVKSIRSFDKDGNLKEKMYYSGTAKWYTFNT